MNNWGIKEKKNRESFEHNPPRPSVERIFGFFNANFLVVNHAGIKAHLSSIK